MAIFLLASCTYKGKNILFKTSHKIKAKNPRTDGVELFGGTTGDFNPYGNTSTQLAAKCRWYQIGCHLQALLDFINANTIPICFVLELFNIPCPPKP